MKETDRRYFFLKDGFKEAKKIRNEVSVAIDEALERIKNHSKSNYALLIAHADYNKALENNNRFYSYTINDYRSINDDEMLVCIKENYLNEAYSSKLKIYEESISNIFFEIALYTHTLESEKHIHEMYRIFKLLSGEDYEWKITKDKGFCRKEIETLSNKVECKLSNIYRNIFKLDHDIRNSFAHNSYTIYFDNEMIHYDFEKITNNITFQEWTKMFLYQSELSVQMYNKIYKKGLSFSEDLGTDNVLINIPGDKFGSRKLVHKNFEDKDGIYARFTIE